METDINKIKDAINNLEIAINLEKINKEWIIFCNHNDYHLFHNNNTYNLISDWWLNKIEEAYKQGSLETLKTLLKDIEKMKKDKSYFKVYRTDYNEAINDIKSLITQYKNGKR